MRLSYIIDYCFARWPDSRRSGMMKRDRVDRRDFIKGIAGSAAAMAAMPAEPFRLAGTRTSVHFEDAQQMPGANPTPAPKIKFAVIGINHNHINSQVAAVQRGGGELVSVYAKEPDLVTAFMQRFPQAKLARSENEILEDRAI